MTQLSVKTFIPSRPQVLYLDIDIHTSLYTAWHNVIKICPLQLRRARPDGN